MRMISKVTAPQWMWRLAPEFKDRSPGGAIEDETRPVDLNSAFQNLSEFVQQQTGDFLIGYWRDLMQSQPHHVEIVAEKLTVRTILQKVARLAHYSDDDHARHVLASS